MRVTVAGVAGVVIVAEAVNAANAVWERMRAGPASGLPAGPSDAGAGVAPCLRESVESTTTQNFTQVRSTQQRSRG